ncbi:ATP-binding protein [Streptomyces sp. TP-A0874]|uniref:ATP-binding protein n=1 Tax=Streptomyces sp. TP-A0874 TaxID=549819 RepID=UPI000852F380|nr:ATP-binding protein [Streptomyces sp. TP-A0874]
MTQASPRDAVVNRFSRHARSVGRARAVLRAQLAVWGIAGDAAEVAELLLSELVTNAVRHACAPQGREIRTLFSVNGGLLRLEVSDASDRQPSPTVAGDGDEGGRGLSLVAALSDDWGVMPREGVGKSVWALVKLPARSVGGLVDDSRISAQVLGSRHRQQRR